jgi:hypothetical protein
MSNNNKTVKFHGQEVHNIIILYSQIVPKTSNASTIEEFDAAKDPQECETINIQVVSEFITITFYKDEKTNSIIRRELIPTYKIEHIWINDMKAQ